jgi:hypothetical protein
VTLEGIEIQSDIMMEGNTSSVPKYKEKKSLFFSNYKKKKPTLIIFKVYFYLFS